MVARWCCLLAIEVGCCLMVLLLDVRDCWCYCLWSLFVVCCCCVFFVVNDCMSLLSLSSLVLFVL